MSDEKIISVEWRLNRRDYEDSSCKFGQLTAAELAVLVTTTFIEFEGETWTVNGINTTWTSRGIDRATIQLYEKGWN